MAPALPCSTMRRVPELDGLRGVAILLVVVGHAVGSTAAGAVGVGLFFALSGFLITGILARELSASGGIDFRAFWARRARRILPALAFPAFAATLVAIVAKGPGPALLLAAAVPVSNIAGALGVDLLLLRQTWSLAVEEQFYLVWPPVLAALWRWKHLVWTLAGAAIASMAWRSGVNAAGHPMWAYMGFLTNAAGLLLGSLLALRPMTIPAMAAWSSGGLLLVLSVVPAAPLAPAWVTVAVAPVAMMLVAGAPRMGLLRVRWLRWCGRVSYGWYLWHWVLMRPVFHTPWAWAAAIVSLGLAAASWRWLEKPLLEARRAPREADTRVTVY